jgi:uncharacterized protein (DUF1697 family)
MSSFVALLRAVNVGGTGKLPMTDLKQICEDLGSVAVRTYIAGGNVVFASRKSEAAIKAALEKRPEAYARKPVGVLVQTAAEMTQYWPTVHFRKAAPNRTMAVFLDRAALGHAGRHPRPAGRTDPVGAPRDLHPLRRRHRGV